MKFVTYSRAPNHAAPGVLTPDATAIVDLSSCCPNLLNLVTLGEDGKALAREALEKSELNVPLADVKLLAPIQNPPRLRDCSVFEEHIKGGTEFAKKMGWDLLAKVPDVWYQDPIFYKGNHLSIAGPEHVVEVPSYSRRLDYELEICAVIGRGGQGYPAVRGT